MKTFWTCVAVVAVAVGVTAAGPQRSSRDPAPNKTTLYLIATAHLDSQWNWTVQDSIRDSIPKTFHDNFALFQKYPDYTFSWEGAIHYMWFKEYHPDEWPTVQQYVAQGRWRLAGSWINAVDVNMPSPESLFRQALYAQRFFRQEFGQEPHDIYLPDCFGFGFALPAIAVESGLTSFSTQKLTWGRPIPFPIGRWKGVDGSEIVAELNPGSYGTRIDAEITPTSTNGGREGAPPWLNDPTNVGDGRELEYRYFGTGDTGGAPAETSVQNIETSIHDPQQTIDIRNTAPDQLAADLTPAEKALLPEYNGELILKTHGTGCYTSQAAMKRFNRSNELLGNEAETAGVAAQYVAGLPYPTERLRDAWIRFIWHQFHDDLTGTCIPQAYQFSWNDEIVSLNQFSNVLTSSTQAVSALMDTHGAGIPLVVYNPLSMERRDPVEADVTFPGPAPASVHVTDAVSGREMLSQVLTRTGSTAHIVFVADAPSMGYQVYHVTASAGVEGGASSLRVTPSSLENNRISVKIDENGDISSIYDKDAKHELLRAPIMLELRDNPSPSWPAWEVLYSTVRSPAREYAANPTVKILEHGPVRVALQITRKASGSTFVQNVRLAEGGDRVDVENLIDWRSPDTELKASFPFSASNPKAVYDLGVGTIARGNDEPDQYEVPAQKWADLDDASGDYGVGVVNDSKYGWDKPDDHTLRLTLLHTPRPGGSYTYQSSNDLGEHRVVFAIAGHAGDWRQGRVPDTAWQLNQPLVAFQTVAHPGVLGADFSMASLSDTTGQVAITAMKRAEDSDEVILRLQERYGQPVGDPKTNAGGVTIHLGVPILGAREVNAAEEDMGPLNLGGGGNRGRGGRGGATINVPPPAPTSITVGLGAYQPRTIALKLQSAWDAAKAFDAYRSAVEAANAANAAAGRAGRGGGRGGFGRGGTPPPNVAQPAAAATATIALPFNLDGVSADAAPSDGDFDGKGHTIAAELLPAQLNVDGVPFAFGSGAAGQKNALVPNGQTIALPAGHFNHLYIVAAAVGGDAPMTVDVAGVPHTMTVREWQGPVGQWWSRLTDIAPSLHEPFAVANGNNGLVVNYDPKTGEVTGIDQIRPAFVKRDEIAWVGPHRHDAMGNQTYVASYLFKYALDLPPGVRQITLPANSKLRIMAVTVSDDTYALAPAGALYVPDITRDTPPIKIR